MWSTGVIYAKDDLKNGNFLVVSVSYGFPGSVNVSHLHSRPLNNNRGKKKQNTYQKAF